MLAASYVGDQTFSVADREAIEPSPGEVRIDVAYVGICGTDLHIKHGAMDRRVDIPAVIGHEMSGRIAAVGDGVADWAIGQAVTVMPLDWCGACAACRAGHQHVCQNLVFVGIDAPGAMQQSWTVPARLLVRLPENLRLDHAALTEPAAVAGHDVRRSGLQAGAAHARSPRPGLRPGDRRLDGGRGRARGLRGVGLRSRSRRGDLRARRAWPPGGGRDPQRADARRSLPRLLARAERDRRTRV